MSIANWDLPQSKITQVSSHEYQVPSQSNPDLTYNADMDAAMCSCPLVYNGGPCKHQHIVAKYFYINSINTDPINLPSFRKLFYKIATGEDGEECRFQTLRKASNELPVGLTQDESSLPVGLTQDESSVSACMDNKTQSSMDLPRYCHDSIGEEIVSEIEKDIDIDISRILKQRRNAKLGVL